mgnify:CR=1 FL=1
MRRLPLQHHPRAAFILHGMGKVQDPTGWMGDALPGRLYLEAVKHLFKRNRLARG